MNYLKLNPNKTNTENSDKNINLDKSNFIARYDYKDDAILAAKSDINIQFGLAALKLQAEKAILENDNYKALKTKSEVLAVQIENLNDKRRKTRETFGDNITNSNLLSYIFKAFFLITTSIGFIFGVYNLISKMDLILSLPISIGFVAAIFIIGKVDKEISNNKFKLLLIEWGIPVMAGFLISILLSNIQSNMGISICAGIISTLLVTTINHHSLDIINNLQYEIHKFSIIRNLKKTEKKISKISIQLAEVNTKILLYQNQANKEMEYLENVYLNEYELGKTLNTEIRETEEYNLIQKKYDHSMVEGA